MSSSEIKFKDYRFEMSPVSRTALNIVIWIWMVVLVVATAAFVISGLPWMRSLGILLALYLANRFVHRNRSNKKLSKLPNSGMVNAADYMSPQAMGALLTAFNRSHIFGGHPYLQLGRDLLARHEVSEALRRLDVSRDEFGAKLVERLNSNLSVRYSREDLSKMAELIAVQAMIQALNGQDDSVSPGDLFAAIPATGDTEAKKPFDLFRISSDDLEKALIFGRFKATARLFRLPAALGGFAGKSSKIKHRFMDRAWTARPTQALDLFSSDVTDMARAGKIGFMVGHKEEYDRLVNVIARPNKPNALLVGDSGSGRKTLIAHLAYMIANDDVPSPLFDKRIVALDLNAIVAGADQGEVQRRVRIVVSEIISAGNVILYIPEIHNLSRTAGSRELSVANTLLPLVISNDFPTIGTTYPKEYKQLIESDTAFANAFQNIEVKEISDDEAERVMVYDSLVLEKVYRVTITYDAIKRAVQLAKKYFRTRLLPSSADDLLKETLTEASRTGDKVINAEDIERVAERRAKIPMHQAGEEERQQLLHLEDIIHQHFVDQEAAVKSVSQALREYRSGVIRKGGPISSFLFVGPTGVGKTKLSKILAKVQFGSESAMTRFDMSEYQDKGSIMRLIGSPDGAINGALTEAVIEHPYSLILLDEFEKASPDILNLFLQVFDDGRLTDSLGRTVSFQNTIIIATSNAHSDFVKDSLGQGKSMSQIASVFKDKLTDVFHPELLNRMTVIVFGSLKPEDLMVIVGLQVQELKDTLKKEKDIELKVSDDVLTKLAAIGYDPVFGARPLRQVIADKLRAPLSEMILSSSADRGSVISATFDGTKIVFNKEQ